MTLPLARIVGTVALTGALALGAAVPALADGTSTPVATPTANTTNRPVPKNSAKTLRASAVIRPLPGRRTLLSAAESHDPAPRPTAEISQPPPAG